MAALSFSFLTTKKTNSLNCYIYGKFRKEWRHLTFFHKEKVWILSSGRLRNKWPSHLQTYIQGNQTQSLTNTHLEKELHILYL